MLIHITDLIFKLKTNIQILLKIFLKNKPLFKMKDQLKYNIHTIIGVIKLNIPFKFLVYLIFCSAFIFKFSLKRRP